jgi:hypothetical protein
MSGTGTISLELVSSKPAKSHLERASSKKLLAAVLQTARENGTQQERCLGCKLLGFRGLLCLSISVAIGGLLIFAYSKFRQGEFILLCGVLSLCIPFKFIYLVWVSAEGNVKDNGALHAEGDGAPIAKAKTKTWYTRMTELFLSVFDPDGKYYLLKTYASELAEYVGQLFALNVYACSLPVWLSTIFYALLACEAFGITLDTFWTLKHGLTVERRNNRVMADIVLEVLSSMIPVSIMNFAYKLNFTLVEFAQIALVPAVFAQLKIYEITEAILRERAIQYRYLKQKNKRLSFFKEGNNENSALAQTQMEHTSQRIHVGFGIISLLYGLYLLSLVVSQLILTPSLQCSVGAVNEKIWDSCEVKVPFCKNVYSPSCDCVVLMVRHHNWTALPDAIGGMTAMKTLLVNDGPLTTLEGMEGLTKLSTVNLNFNHLEHVPDALGALHVTRLELAFNRLRGLPLSVWDNPYLKWVDISSNDISKIEPGIRIAKTLKRLFLANNSLGTFPQQITQLTSLWYLSLGGNNIAMIPSGIRNLNRLEILLLHNNRRIREVPREIGSCVNLKLLDIRNNNITFLPRELEGLERLLYIYMENNPICENGWMSAGSNNVFVDSMESRAGSNSGCSKQCSLYCQSFAQTINDRCLKECNSKACKYQNGACLT